MEQATLSEFVALEVLSELGRRRQSRVWLAKESGKSVSWVTRRLAGTSVISVDDLLVFARTLDIPLQRLLPTDPEYRSPTRQYTPDNSDPWSAGAHVHSNADLVAA